jgi:uncharacterized protein YyaL (SSP411 family)
MAMTTATFTNRLVRESSPYLRQHAHNPVDWFPWGPEALERARKLDRPIFLSIGYSACHWCHVMEHESFENPDIAQILNDNFVAIKVDREERPDLDQIYMTAVQMISGQGGWPMSVFLTPNLRPFTGGTYFPPEDRYGRPGFRRILLMLADSWKERRADIDRAAGEITEHLQGVSNIEGGQGELSPDLIQGAANYLGRAFDATYGGFGKAPKFLHTMDLRLLLRVAKRFGDEDALQMVRHTLEQMAMGGIYDHLGGGFARYSTDDRWLVPHFEKMLYDNALLPVVYLETWQSTREDYFREVAEETLDWVQREMTSLQGPFYSTLDADSEGVEGKFYVWTREEVGHVLGPTDAELFSSCYGVRPEGNWEDPHHPGGGPKNILHRTKSYAQLAQTHGLGETRLKEFLGECRQKLFKARRGRVRPGLDDKALTSWNGLMITAFATAAQVLDKQDYAATAERAAKFILARLRTPNGRLLRTWSPGGEAKLNGYLEDYAFLIEGLTALYEATFEARWIGDALGLADVMVDQFWDAEGGGFFYTGRDHERLIARNKDPHDNALPSGNAVATTALLRLSALTGRSDLQDRAETTLRLYGELMKSHPFAAGQMLLGLDFYLDPVQEFAVVGDPRSEETRRVLRVIHSGFRPNKVVALRPVGGTVREDLLGLLEGRLAIDGRTTTYLCENFTCREPLVGAEAVEGALKGA